MWVKNLGFFRTLNFKKIVETINESLASGGMMFRLHLGHHQDKEVCRVEGVLTFESANQFKKWCEEQGDQVKNLPIHLGGLHFVGSTGIMSFIEGLRALEEKQQSPVQIQEAQPEFKILCQGLGFQGIQFL